MCYRGHEIDMSSFFYIKKTIEGEAEKYRQR